MHVSSPSPTSLDYTSQGAGGTWISETVSSYLLNGLSFFPNKPMCILSTPYVTRSHDSTLSIPFSRTNSFHQSFFVIPQINFVEPTSIQGSIFSHSNHLYYLCLTASVSSNSFKQTIKGNFYVLTLFFRHYSIIGCPLVLASLLLFVHPLFLLWQKLWFVPDPCLYIHMNVNLISKFQCWKCQGQAHIPNQVCCWCLPVHLYECEVCTL